MSSPRESSAVKYPAKKPSDYAPVEKGDQAARAFAARFPEQREALDLTSPTRRGTGSRTSPMPNFCHQCGIPGHRGEECPNVLPDIQQGIQQMQQDEARAAAAAPPPPRFVMRSRPMLGIRVTSPRNPPVAVKPGSAPPRLPTPRGLVVETVSEKTEYLAKKKEKQVTFKTPTRPAARRAAPATQAATRTRTSTITVTATSRQRTAPQATTGRGQPTPATTPSSAAVQTMTTAATAGLATTASSQHAATTTVTSTQKPTTYKGKSKPAQKGKEKAKKHSSTAPATSTVTEELARSLQEGLTVQDKETGTFGQPQEEATAHNTSTEVTTTTEDTAGSEEAMKRLLELSEGEKLLDEMALETLNTTIQDTGLAMPSAASASQLTTEDGRTLHEIVEKIIDTYGLKRTADGEFVKRSAEPREAASRPGVTQVTVQVHPPPRARSSTSTGRVTSTTPTSSPPAKKGKTDDESEREESLSRGTKRKRARCWSENIGRGAETQDALPIEQSTGR